MKYSYNEEDSGYPFKYDCLVTWKLESDNRLTVTTECVNNDERSIPMQDGWHPYFTFGNSIDDLHLEFQSMEIVEFNKDLIPTGKLTEYDQYKSHKKIGDTIFDNCFTINFGTGQPMCSLKDMKNNIQVEFHPSQSYPYLQIYTPPDRKSIAIENLSGTPDGFNNNSFQTLEPGHSSLYNVTYKITRINKDHE
jgi:aldose 1-epimerase